MQPTVAVWSEPAACQARLLDTESVLSCYGEVIPGEGARTLENLRPK